MRYSFATWYDVSVVPAISAIITVFSLQDGWLQGESTSVTRDAHAWNIMVQTGRVRTARLCTYDGLSEFLVVLLFLVFRNN